MAKYIDIVMAAPPGPDSEFIEVEDDQGYSRTVGEWIKPDGKVEYHWRFRIKDGEIGGLDEL